MLFDKDRKNGLSCFKVILSSTYNFGRRMEGRRGCGRQNATMLDWMKCKPMGYVHIKRRAREREDWHHWRSGHA